jgi:tRNA (guanine37-N1)-methyltransferase
MKQEKLEEKVRQLFERQGFQIEDTDQGFEAVKDEEKLALKVFSSDNYSLDDVKDSVSGDEKVFVDEELAEVENEIDNVSVIRGEEDEKEYDLPSYELIGEIAVINELTVEEDEAVEGILEHHPSVKTILLKEEPLQGEYRVGEYRKLYGEETETVHKEFGCNFKVDPTKVYYSERFSTERKRVVDQIEDGEKVLVMFAGVGPFAVMAGKLADPEKVIAVEKNPVAADYLKENIELNNLEDRLEGYEGDVREVVPELDEKFDRVIMPLPAEAESFLDLALNKTTFDSVIHLYCFSEEGIESEISRYDSLFISDRVLCGERSPKSYRVCYDLEKLK